MDRELDYSQHDEAELVERFGRMDPRYAPQACAGLGKHLTKLGYIVTHGDTGPGFVTPSPQKLQALIGSPRPFECDVEFGKDAVFYGYRLAEEDHGVSVGVGGLRVDGICLYLSCRTGGGSYHFDALGAPRYVEVPTRRILNVESHGPFIRFEYTSPEADPEAMILRLADEVTATALVAILPKVRTKGFRPKIQALTWFKTYLPR